MTRYLLRRLVGLVPLLMGITVICFAVIHLAPGGPTDLQTELNPKVSAQARARLTQLYGLDQPLHIQYGRWLGRLLRGDLGRSFVDDRPVAEKILERIPVTLTIEVSAMLLILLVAVPMGVVGAVRPGSFADQATATIAFVGFAMPGFWLALLLMSWCGVRLGWLPISGIQSLEYEALSGWEQWWDRVRHLVLPVGVSAFGGVAGLSRFMRASMAETLQQPYIRTAVAKGLPARQVLYRHALRNALLPVITILGLSVPGLISGSVIFESIFAIPGMGRLYFDAVMARDYPIIMGILVIGAVLTLVGNLLADVAYAVADPRIRYE